MRLDDLLALGDKNIKRKWRNLWNLNHTRGPHSNLLLLNNINKLLHTTLCKQTTTSNGTQQKSLTLNPIRPPDGSRRPFEFVRKKDQSKQRQGAYKLSNVFSFDQLIHSTPSTAASNTYNTAIYASGYYLYLHVTTANAIHVCLYTLEC